MNLKTYKLVENALKNAEKIKKESARCTRCRKAGKAGCMNTEICIGMLSIVLKMPDSSLSNIFNTHGHLYFAGRKENTRKKPYKFMKLKNEG